MSKSVKKFVVVLDESARAAKDGEFANPGRVGSAAICFEVPSIGVASKNLREKGFSQVLPLKDQRRRILDAMDATDMWQLVWKINAYSTQNRGALYGTIGTLEFFDNLYPDDALFFHIIYDSELSADMFIKGRLRDWRRMGWTSSSKRGAPENVDLLRRLADMIISIRKRNPKTDEYKKIPTVTASHTKAHTVSKSYVSVLNRWVDRYCGFVATHSRLLVNNEPLQLSPFDDETYKKPGERSTLTILTTVLPSDQVYSDIGKIYDSEDIIVKEQPVIDTDTTKNVRLRSSFKAGCMHVDVYISCSASTGRPINHTRNVGYGGSAYLSNAYAIIELAHMMREGHITETEKFLLHVKDPAFQFLSGKTHPKKNRDVWEKAKDLFGIIVNNVTLVKY